MVAEVDANPQEQWMARAIEEARRAAGATSPNPMVGCVLVDDGELLAAGYHRGPGRAHAEVDALQRLEGSPAGVDVYVTLEPCCHQGRTPPCTEALVEADVGRVLVGCRDPDPRVSGRGLERLREAGIEVTVGVLEDEVRRLNRPYFKYTAEDRPWVSVKYAMSLDGKIATRTGESAWITNEASRRRVHELRDLHDAIMVGTGTLESDDPRLTCRIDGGHDPLRVVLDTRLEAPLDSNVYHPEDDGADTLVAIGEDADDARRETLRARGVETLAVPTDERGFLALQPLFDELAERDVVRLFVEGGGTLLGSLFDEDRVDRVYAFVGAKVIGGDAAPGPIGGDGAETMADALQIEDAVVETFDGDVLVAADID